MNIHTKFHSNPPEPEKSNISFKIYMKEKFLKETPNIAANTGWSDCGSLGTGEPLAYIKSNL